MSTKAGEDHALLLLNNSFVHRDQITETTKSDLYLCADISPGTPARLDVASVKILRTDTVHRSERVIVNGPQTPLPLSEAVQERHSRRPAVFVPAWKLGVARAQHGLGHGEAPEVEQAFAAGLCVLDDLGSERNTAMNAVPDVLYARALEGRPTWVTTWMTPEAVTQRYGDGIARRLFEAGRAVVIACGKVA